MSLPVHTSQTVADKLVTKFICRHGTPCVNIQTKDANLNRSYLLNYAAYYKLKYLELHLKDLNRME